MLETKWGNTNSNPLLVGVEMARPLERQLGDVLQNETYCYHAAQQSRALVFIPKSWRLKSTQRSLHEIYRSFIKNCQNLEALKMPPGG